MIMNADHSLRLIKVIVQRTSFIFYAKNVTVRFVAAGLMIRSIRDVMFGCFNLFNSMTSLRARSHEARPRIETFLIATQLSVVASMALTTTP